ncbi:hypothetical protein JKP88DRAFT_273589 [Tribonema minus]|uniref:Uncharacterized protein n=1 Tax=Tribonema minus TaxID=303371 RepID=A0A835YRC9_9STRA|nr:hypothetical protein JKP88DRAFT_273589 [Tribonema minus]
MAPGALGRLHGGDGAVITTPILPPIAIFDTLGKGHWLFVAGVARRWRGRYFRVCDTVVRSGARLLVTDLSAAILSPSCLALAFETNPDLDPDRLGRFFLLVGAKGRPAGVDVIALARVYGMDWDPNLVAQAAASGDAARLQWLVRHRHGMDRDAKHLALAGASGDAARVQWLVRHRCPYSGEIVAQGAAYSGSLDMLKWVRQANETWEYYNLAHVLSWAGLRGHVHVAKWLLAQGAPWPLSVLVNVRFLVGAQADVYDCWSPAFAAWALDNGWDWAGWNCLATLQASAPECAAYGAKYAALQEWAHAHSCPCRCGAAAAAAAGR